MLIHRTKERIIDYVHGEGCIASLDKIYDNVIWHKWGHCLYISNFTQKGLFLQKELQSI